MLRLFTKLGGDTSNPVFRERLRRSRERYPALPKVEAVVFVITILGLCAYVFIALSLSSW